MADPAEEMKRQLALAVAEKEAEIWKAENQYYSVYDREKIKIGYIEECEVKGCTLNKHAFAKCDGEWVVPVFGKMWSGCGKRYCYYCMLVEHER